MRNWNTNILATGLVVSGLVFSCGKKKEEDADTGLASATSPADLNVSGSMTVTLPTSLAGKTTSLMLSGDDGFELTASKKSGEACRLGSTVNEITERLSDIGSFFCHMEVEKTNIKFGKKYKITTKGKEFGRIWIDNSKVADGMITMYMFQDGKLRQKIDITGVDTVRKVAKGTVSDQGSQGTQTWASTITFDAGYTTDKKMVISAQQKFTDSTGAASFARTADLVVFTDNSDTSSVKLASKGTNGGQTFKDRGFGKFDGNYGESLFESEGTYAGQTFSFVRKSYFDKEGYTTASTTSADFASGGKLYIAKTDLPSFYTDSPTAPSGWDGSVDETLDLDPDSADHKACETKNKKHEQRNCWGTDFEDGATEK